MTHQLGCQWEEVAHQQQCEGECQWGWHGSGRSGVAHQRRGDGVRWHIGGRSGISAGGVDFGLCSCPRGGAIHESFCRDSKHLLSNCIDH